MADLTLCSIGDNKVQLIKLVREITGLGLKEAKDIVDKIDAGEEYTLSLEAGKNIIEIESELRALGVTFWKSVDKNGANTRVAEKEKNDLVETVETWSKYVPTIPSSEVSKLDRENTLLVLKEVKQITEDYESFAPKINALNSKIKEAKDEAEKIRKKVSDEAMLKIWGITIGVAIITCLFGGIIVAIICGIIARFITMMTIEAKDLAEHSAENNANAEAFILSNVVPLQEQLKELCKQKAVLFVVLLMIAKNGKCDLLKIQLLSYAIFRFILEFYRGDDVRGFWFGVSTSQWISVLIVIYYIVNLIISRKFKIVEPIV